jgi:hypothetical protein
VSEKSAPSGDGKCRDGLWWERSVPVEEEPVLGTAAVVHREQQAVVQQGEQVGHGRGVVQLGPAVQSHLVNNCSTKPSCFLKGGGLVETLKDYMMMNKNSFLIVTCHTQFFIVKRLKISYFYI